MATHIPFQNIEYVDYSNYKTVFLRNGSNTNFNVNGAITPVPFSYKVPNGKDFLLYTFMIHMTDGGIFTLTEFGGLQCELDNGLRLYLTNGQDVEVEDFFDNDTVKFNGDFSAFAGQSVLETTGQVIEWRVTESTGGRPIRIPKKHSLVLLVQDDLSPLRHAQAMMHGILTDSIVVP